jgi:hypothetical protein
MSAEIVKRVVRTEAMFAMEWKIAQLSRRKNRKGQWIPTPQSKKPTSFNWWASLYN